MPDITHVRHCLLCAGNALIAAAFMVTLVPVFACWAGTDQPDGLSSVIDEASKMAIVDTGRIKPLQTYARDALLRFSGRSSYHGVSAIGWLCRVILNPQTTSDDTVFLINNPEVADAIGIAPQKQRRYTFNQLWSCINKLEEETRKIAAVNPKARSAVEKELLRVDANVLSYIEIGAALSFALPMPGFSITDTALASYLSITNTALPPSYYQLLGKSDLLHAAVANAMGRRDRRDWSAFDSNAVVLAEVMSQWGTMHQNSNFKIIPVPEKGGLRWLDPGTVVKSQGLGAHSEKIIVALVNAFDAYKNGEYARCAFALREINGEVQKRIGAQGVCFNASLELLYNSVDPFFKALLAYGIAFCLLIAGARSSARWWRTGGAIVIALGFCIHLAGLVARIFIMHRFPAVTQYEIFVFISLLCVALGSVLELFQKKGLGLIVGSLLGAVFIGGALRFGAEGDTMGTLAPVLNNNFWLTIHFITIASGFAGFVGAGVLAHMFLVQKAFLRRSSETLASMIYGVLAFGLTFTTIGTVLGGLWADQAWGRFWGWDPKENGALLVILWCAAIFHARKGGIIQEKGTAFGAVIGLVLVSLAWVGVNLLGVGRHVYGFGAAGSRILFFVLAVEFVFIAVVSARLYILTKKGRGLVRQPTC
jgi:ABC-type transport system involved in cytochrome c biogenesis permease subunit